ncbi:Hydroxysteroid dehydrogenase-like protein 2 [Porphyridium purpureum]|uniref:Hydroxysteroid dehydrogenase-like protein 2 n=1 Tax=Porphyridium purpureum TaxID=35688 RepID=A0A5J4YXS4_PORPP|nr:Hydroxysteroid dehydrogenase-like protein 2 [Porphyridium purpureum]|eukprot:POR2987..scf209_3
MGMASGDASLRGRVAIVTGSSRGIGRQIALDLAARGVNVVITGKSETEQPNLPGTIYSVAKEAEAFGVQALPIKLNVRSDADVLNMVEQTMRAFGRIDILVCNSGALWWKDVVQTPMSKYDLVHEVNVRGTFACVHAVLPIMLKQGYGHIITMSPPIELDWMKGKVAYLISKYGMTMVALGLAKEVAGKGVAINSLWPVTLVESYATMNFNMSERSQWRKASILSDAVCELVQEDPATTQVNGQMLLDEPYLRSKGFTDFVKYRLDPAVEPQKMWPPPDLAKIVPQLYSKL